MKISFITTVFNEEKTIEDFLNSLFSQAKLPDEIIIVDGGSSDNTVAKIKNEKLKMKNFKGKFLILEKKGNRSMGRNKAIKSSKGEIITCSDAGCVLDSHWLERITKPFKNNNIDVVAGFYKGAPKTLFQQCLVPYVLVMPDKVKSCNFLPATRSMAFRKKVWKKIGGFDEQFSHNEDYVFSKKLKQVNANIFFEKNAIVHWLPRKNIKEAFNMFYRFAYGDGESGILRPKVLMIFTRYIFGFIVFTFGIVSSSFHLIFYTFVLVLIYILWAVKKNYRYVKHWKAFFILPALQIVSDIAVIGGTINGLVNRITEWYNPSYDSGIQAKLGKRRD